MSGGKEQVRRQCSGEMVCDRMVSRGEKLDKERNKENFRKRKRDHLK